jgi:arylsulfatase A-like enzyme
LLTGRTPSQVGIHDWIQEQYEEFGDYDWLRDEVTLPQLLQSAGYRCGLSGKWHLGRSHETPRGFDWCFGLPRWQGSHQGTYTYHLNGTPLTLEGNKTQIITDHALQFLGDSPMDEPFFLNVGYIATHSPYAEQEDELVRLYSDAGFGDIPPYVSHPWAKNEDFSNGDDWTPDDCRRRYANYYAAVTDIDHNVGRILQKLEEQGRLNNTIVIYTADHGLTLGHHGFWGKGNSTRPLNMHETCLRVPLIWRWPGMAKAGYAVTQSVSHYDTFRTVCEVAGVPFETEHNYPGRSYRALLEGRIVRDWNDTICGEYGDLRMIRTPNWKYVQRFSHGPHELWNLRNDPQESNNLIDQKPFSGIQSTLEHHLQRFYGQYSDAKHSGWRVKELHRHNRDAEAWRDGRREARGLQVY